VHGVRGGKFQNRCGERGVCELPSVFLESPRERRAGGLQVHSGIHGRGRRDVRGVRRGDVQTRRGQRRVYLVPREHGFTVRERRALRLPGFTWTDTTTFKGRSRKREEEPQPCDCASERPQNAAMMYECLYAAGCTNRQLQDLAQNPRTVPDLEVFDTQGGKGFGVRAMSDLRAGSLICEYVGEALERHHFEKRRGTRSSKGYFLRADDVVIDAARRGNTSRFVNHSCSPSAEVQVWKVPTADGLSVRTAVAIIARHFIKKDSEITYDYRFECFEDALQTQCLCGSSRVCTVYEIFPM
jgi:SET domain-containing protein